MTFVYYWSQKSISDINQIRPKGKPMGTWGILDAVEEVKENKIEDRFADKEHLYALDKAFQYFESLTPVGSRVSCDPPPKGTDQDILIKCKSRDKAIKAVKLLAKFGWEYGGSMGIFDADKPVDNQFHALRHPLNDWNLILTHSKEWHKSFLCATRICRHYNILDKEDRIILFDAIMKRRSDNLNMEALECINTMKPEEFTLR